MATKQIWGPLQSEALTDIVGGANASFSAIDLTPLDLTDWVFNVFCDPIGPAAGSTLDVYVRLDLDNSQIAKGDFPNHFTLVNSLLLTNGTNQTKQISLAAAAGGILPGQAKVTAVNNSDVTMATVSLHYRNIQIGDDGT